MPNIEEQNLTEFLLEVKAKMVNITISENHDINEINDYVLSNTGKFVRSKIIYHYGNEIGVKHNKLLELSAAAELIHLSTLIHDDIIDEADIRRNKPTVVKKWGLKKAVLYGDFLYTKTFQALNSLDNTDIADELIRCAEKLIEGEFNQLKIHKEGIVSESEYYDVIEKKTAVLFSGILKCLGIEMSFNNEDQSHLQSLGLAFGKAFQINDDLSDFLDSDKTGKAKFKDLNEGKLTLPAIFLFNSVDEIEKAKINKLIESGDYYAVNKLIESKNGFENARKARDEAIDDCIEYTERFIKLDKLESLKIFLRETLVA